MGIIPLFVRQPHPRVIKEQKYPIIGQARDVNGKLFHVREIRTTKHGFDLLFGSRESSSGKIADGHRNLIATQPLLDYWETNRIKQDGAIYDLPAGRTTIKRLRKRFGFNQNVARFEWWQDRIEDLKNLKAREFARRHNVNIFVVMNARLKMVGPIARELGWWNKPEYLEILRSNLTLREIGKKLGIGTSHAHRLKKRARALDLPTPDSRLLTPSPSTQPPQQLSV